MIIKNTKFLLLTIFLTGGGAIFLMQYTRQVHHTFIATNYAGLQNNPFEFFGMVKNPNHEKILQKIEDGLQCSMDSYFSEEELTNLEIPSKLWHLTPRELLTKTEYRDCRLIDKTARKINVARYSLLLDIRQVDNEPIMIEKGADHFTLWDRYFNDRINAKTVLLPSGEPLPHFSKAKMALKFFDLTLIRILEKEDLLEQATTLQKNFYEGPIGNPETKAFQLFRFYQQSDIVCIQESGPRIIHLMQKEYHVLGRAGGSLICLRKRVWKKVQKINLHLDTYPSDEFLVLVVQHERSGKKMILASLHSDGKGVYSIPILHLLHQTIEGDPTLKGLPLLIAHDANTSATEKSNKAPLEAYWKVANSYGFDHVFPFDKPTTHKIRSSAQLQLDKVNELAEDKEDWILYREITIRKKKMTLSGPNEENPTDHTILYIRFSF